MQPSQLKFIKIRPHCCQRHQNYFSKSYITTLIQKIKVPQSRLKSHPHSWNSMVVSPWSGDPARLVIPETTGRSPEVQTLKNIQQIQIAQRRINIQKHEGVACSGIYLLYWSHEKSHGLIPSHPSQRYPRAVTLPTTAYFPIFPSSRLAIRFTGMLGKHKLHWPAACFCWFLFDSSALKMNAPCSSETLVDFHRTKRPYSLEGRTIHSDHCENFKSRICGFFVFPMISKKMACYKKHFHGL
jgi:hypothetical protein